MDGRDSIPDESLVISHPNPLWVHPDTGNSSERLAILRAPEFKFYQKEKKKLGSLRTLDICCSTVHISMTVTLQHFLRNEAVKRIQSAVNAIALTCLRVYCIRQRPLKRTTTNRAELRFWCTVVLNTL
jgi:hypothetical protein